MTKFRVYRYTSTVGVSRPRHTATAGLGVGYVEFVVGLILWEVAASFVRWSFAACLKFLYRSEDSSEGFLYRSGEGKN